MGLKTCVQSVYQVYLSYVWLGGVKNSSTKRSKKKSVEKCYQSAIEPIQMNDNRHKVFAESCGLSHVYAK